MTLQDGDLQPNHTTLLKAVYGRLKWENVLPIIEFMALRALWVSPLFYPSVSR